MNQFGREDLRATSETERRAKEKNQSNLAARAPQNDKYSEAAILQAVINNKKGVIIVQCEAARKAMTDNARYNLSKEQFLALDAGNKEKGMYSSNSNDGLLVANIKQMSNVLTRVERLAAKMNQVSEYASNGILAGTNIPGVLREAKIDLEELKKELKQLNESLMQMRESLTATAYEEMAGPLQAIFGELGKNFPYAILELSSTAETADTFSGRPCLR